MKRSTRSSIAQTPIVVLIAVLSLTVYGCSGDRANKREHAVFESVERVNVPRSHEAAASAHLLVLDRERLMAIATPGRVSNFLRMPDSRTLDFDVVEVEEQPPRVWRGRLYLNDQPQGSFTLSRSGERLAASFRLGEDRFQIKSAPTGELVLIQLKRRVPPPPGPPEVR